MHDQKDPRTEKQEKKIHGKATLPWNRTVPPGGPYVRQQLRSFGLPEFTRGRYSIRSTDPRFAAPTFDTYRDHWLYFLRGAQSGSRCLGRTVRWLATLASEDPRSRAKRTLQVQRERLQVPGSIPRLVSALGTDFQSRQRLLSEPSLILPHVPLGRKISASKP